MAATSRTDKASALDEILNTRTIPQVRKCHLEMRTCYASNSPNNVFYPTQALSTKAIGTDRVNVSMEEFALAQVRYHHKKRHSKSKASEEEHSSSSSKGRCES